MKGDSLVLAEAMERIRELEADYRHENEGRRAIEALYTEQKARAEKAEAHAKEWADKVRELIPQLESSEARVAELKSLVQQVGNDHHRGNDPACEDAIELLAAFEAREREAE